MARSELLKLTFFVRKTTVIPIKNDDGILGLVLRANNAELSVCLRKNGTVNKIALARGFQSGEIMIQGYSEFWIERFNILGKPLEIVAIVK